MWFKTILFAALDRRIGEKLFYGDREFRVCKTRKTDEYSLKKRFLKMSDDE